MVLFCACLLDCLVCWLGFVCFTCVLFVCFCFLIGAIFYLCFVVLFVFLWRLVCFVICLITTCYGGCCVGFSCALFLVCCS